MKATESPKLVIVDYQDLLESGSQVLSDAISQAYGSQGIGILAIRNVPDFVQAKHNCLEQAFPLAHLDPKQLKELEDPDSFFNAGWSHGKEMIKPNQPDLAKASFYFNPITDLPGTLEERTQFPASYPANKWPTQALPTLEPAAKTLGRLLTNVALLLAPHLDAYVRTHRPTYPQKYLEKAFDQTEKVKGRLLYYYPLPDKNDDSTAAVDSWIGFHNDSGYLTCLAGDLYLSPPEGTIVPPAPDTGLHVEDRQGQVHRIEIPADCMAIQIGECAQIVSGGALMATPHCVKGAPNTIRVSLACFVDVPPTTPISLPPNCEGEMQTGSSQRVPPLKERWHNGMTFGDFLAKTFETYYAWNA